MSEIQQQASSANGNEEKKPLSMANIFLVGTSFIGGGSVLFAGLGLIRDQPDRAFGLLQAWGPWFFLASFIAWAVSRLSDRAIEIFGRVGDRLADSVEKIATEQGRQAIALQTAADKDDRQLQEMQTLTSLTAQRSEKTYSMLQDYHESILQQLERIEAKVDTKTT